MALFDLFRTVITMPEMTITPTATIPRDTKPANGDFGSSDGCRIRLYSELVAASTGASNERLCLNWRDADLLAFLSAYVEGAALRDARVFNDMLQT